MSGFFLFLLYGNFTSLFIRLVYIILIKRNEVNAQNRASFLEFDYSC